MEIDPFFIQNRYNLAQALILQEKFEEASRHLDFILKHGLAKTHRYFNLKGFVLLWQHQYQKALEFFRKALAIAPNDSSVLLNVGTTLSRLSSFENAEWFLLRARKASPEDMMPHFFLIENAVRKDDPDAILHYATALLSQFSMISVKRYLEAPGKNLAFPPLEKNRIAPVIYQAMKKIP